MGRTMARYAPPSCQLAGAICALFLLNACIGSLDGDDAAADYTSAADDAYEGESNTVLDLIQTGGCCAASQEGGEDSRGHVDSSNSAHVRHGWRSVLSQRQIKWHRHGVWSKLEPKGPHAPETTRHYQGYLDQ